MDIVSVDIGGTNARFAIAKVTNGKVVSLTDPVTLRTADHASLPDAWLAFEHQLDRPIPRAAAIAIASPITRDVIRMTNSSWKIRPSQIADQLNLERYTLINDFGAIGHAVAQLPADCFDHLCGPDGPLPAEGVTTVCGPGTGLGVAQVFRTGSGYHVLPTEGGHIDFAPLDAVDDAILAHLRESFSRVSVERVCAGPGIVAIYETLAAREGKELPARGDKAIWTAALEDKDPIAAAAVERFCLILGSVAGDLALAQGANGVVIAGGLGLRIRDRLLTSGFDKRFVAKGRFQTLMAGIPVKLITHPQPGLFGAAAAFAQEHGA